MRKKRFMPISASSGSIHDMISALEDKLDEVGASTKIQASDAVYKDPDGILGLSPDETITYSELEDYWDKNHDSDPELEQFSSMTEWLNVTLEWLEEVDDVEGCDMPIQGASGSIRDMISDLEGKLNEVNSSTTVEGAQDLDDKIWEIADRYSASSPLSGDWSNESAHELAEIMKETGLSEGHAKAKMIELLGFDPHEVYALEPLDASTSVQAADASSGIGEEYIQKLMDTVVKTMKMGPKSEYEVDDQKGNILLTSVSDDGVIIEYTIPIKDLGGNLKEDAEYISKSIQEG